MTIKEHYRGLPPLPSDIEQRIVTLTPIFQRYGVRLAYLFGSLVYVQQRHSKPQDVDIAVLLPEDGELSRLYADVMQHLRTARVHVVDLRAAPLHMQFEVIRTGKLIYRCDEETENDYELRVILKWQDAQPWRRRQWQLFLERLGITNDTP